jgi:hypothetical protein
MANCRPLLARAKDGWRVGGNLAYLWLPPVHPTTRPGGRPSQGLAPATSRAERLAHTPGVARYGATHILSAAGALEHDSRTGRDEDESAGVTGRCSTQPSSRHCKPPHLAPSNATATRDDGAPDLPSPKRRRTCHLLSSSIRRGDLMRRHALRPLFDDVSARTERLFRGLPRGALIRPQKHEPDVKDLSDTFSSSTT